MADRDALQADIMAALQAAKPVTRDSALDVALGILRPVDPKAAGQFETWFEKNGATLVEMVNG